MTGVTVTGDATCAMLGQRADAIGVTTDGGRYGRISKPFNIIRAVPYQAEDFAHLGSSKEAHDPETAERNWSLVSCRQAKRTPSFVTKSFEYRKTAPKVLTCGLSRSILIFITKENGSQALQRFEPRLKKGTSMSTPNRTPKPKVSQSKPTRKPSSGPAASWACYYHPKTNIYSITLAQIATEAGLR